MSLNQIPGYKPNPRPRNDLGRGTYITGLPQLDSDVPLGTGQDYSVPVVTPTPTALPAPRRASAPSVTVTPTPNTLGGADNAVTVNIPVPTKPPGSTAQTVGDVADATSAEKSNWDMVREAMGLKEPGYDRMEAGRFERGPAGFLQQGYSPGGNSWMWFTGGSPFPVQEGPQYMDAIGEVLRNLNAARDYERKRKKWEEEQARRQGQGQTTSVGDGTIQGFPPAHIPGQAMDEQMGLDLRGWLDQQMTGVPTVEDRLRGLRRPPGGGVDLSSRGWW